MPTITVYQSGGIWMEKKFYEDIKDMEGKEVELRYKGYRFVFQF